MEFRLFYRGPLKSNGSVKEKHHIRMALHPQLKELWRQEPLSGLPYLHMSPTKGTVSVLETRKDVWFASVVTRKLSFICHLDILMLRPGEPGALLSGGISIIG